MAKLTNKKEVTEQEKLLERWERFADASADEKRWMHERLNWLLISQPVLLAAIAFAAKPDDCTKLIGQSTLDCMRLYDVLTVVPKLAASLGLVISFLVFVNLCAAGIMHWKWTNRTNELAARIGTQSPEGFTSDVSFGTKPHWPARSSSIIPPFIGFFFVVFWLVFLWMVIRGGNPLSFLGAGF